VASGTGRTALLTVVDAIAQGNHLRRYTFWKRSAGIWMSALRRFGRGCHNIAGRSRGTRAWRDGARTTSGATLINDPVDPSTHIVGDVERTIRSDCEARGTMRCTLGGHYRSRKAVGE